MNTGSGGNLPPRYKIIPIFLNVLLAWLKSFVTNLPFLGILGFTFGAGMFLFMLPPVPQMQSALSTVSTKEDGQRWSASKTRLKAILVRASGSRTANLPFRRPCHLRPQSLWLLVGLCSWAASQGASHAG